MPQGPSIHPFCLYIRSPAFCYVLRDIVVLEHVPGHPSDTPSSLDRGTYPPSVSTSLTSLFHRNSPLYFVRPSTGIEGNVRHTSTESFTYRGRVWVGSDNKGEPSKFPRDLGKTGFV